MIRESGVIFTKNEQRLFEAVAPLLHIQFNKGDADEERLFRHWNSLCDGSVIPAKRLRGARVIAKTLEGAITEQSDLQYWYDKAAAEGITAEELGDISNPRSGAYMAKVLAEARQGQMWIVRRAADLLELALSETQTQDLGNAVGSSI